MKKKVYDPIKEQLMVVLELIRISEKNSQINDTQELMDFRDYFNYVVRQIELYMNYEILKAEKKDG